MEYGLIGEKLGHSASKEIHEQLADYSYELHPLTNRFCVFIHGSKIRDNCLFVRNGNIQGAKRFFFHKNRKIFFGERM